MNESKFKIYQNERKKKREKSVELIKELFD